MNKKINVFTLLIFVYSVIVCLTCNRDFSVEISKAPVISQPIMLHSSSGVHADQAELLSSTSMRTSRN